jgi:hypothetical protein
VLRVPFKAFAGLTFRVLKVSFLEEGLDLAGLDLKDLLEAAEIGHQVRQPVLVAQLEQTQVVVEDKLVFLVEHSGLKQRGSLQILERGWGHVLFDDGESEGPVDLADKKVFTLLPKLVSRAVRTQFLCFSLQIFKVVLIGPEDLKERQTLEVLKHCV